VQAAANRATRRAADVKNDIFFMGSGLDIYHM
jgi:hypothetical protein